MLYMVTIALLNHLLRRKFAILNVLWKEIVHFLFWIAVCLDPVITIYGNNENLTVGFRFTEVKVYQTEVKIDRISKCCLILVFDLWPIDMTLKINGHEVVMVVQILGLYHEQNTI